MSLRQKSKLLIPGLPADEKIEAKLRKQTQR